MADTSVVTSEASRWEIHPYLEDEFRPPPDARIFLGGSRMDSDDWDLYYLEWDSEDSDGPKIWAINEYGDTYAELVETIDKDSYQILLEGLVRAQNDGCIKLPDPTENSDLGDNARDFFQDKKHSETAVYLGSSRVVYGEEFYLYYAPRDEERNLCSGVYAFHANAEKTDDTKHGAWPSIKGHLPLPRYPEDYTCRAIWEAIRRALAQGFEYPLCKLHGEAKKLEEAGRGLLPYDPEAAKAGDTAPIDATILSILMEALTGKKPQANQTTNKGATAVNAVNAAKLLPAHSNAVKTENKNGTETAMSTKTETAMTTATTQNKGGKKFTNVTVARSTDEQIHLPEGMSMGQAREWLTRIETNEEQVIRWSETIDAYPLDGALALRRVFQARFGNAVKNGATAHSFFVGEFEVPPSFVAVEVGVNETVHVPWGNFTIPLIPEHKINVGVDFKNKQLYFMMHAEVKRKYEPLLKEIAEQVREEIKTRSIYKGKALRVKFPTDEQTKEFGFNPHEYAPRFIEAKANGILILSDAVQEQVETNLFTPVTCTQKCREHRIPLKRGVLLEGKYGTGKTLTASTLAQLCVENDWTFIYLSDVKDLEQAMHFARRYEPAVIFAEDIDQVMEDQDGEQRDEEMNKILNTIDGVDMKNVEQMVVLTSNHVKKITKAMLRPGRLDAVITIDPPDQGAVVKLFRHYAAGLLDNATDHDLGPAAKVLAGQIPSVIREVVERSKLASIRRTKDGNEILVNGKDLEVAARGIMNHVKLLQEPEVDTRSDLEKAADRLGGHFAAAVIGPKPNGSSHTIPTAQQSTRALPPADAE